MTRRGLVLGLFVMGMLFAARTEAATYHVSFTGNDANSCTAAQSTTPSNQKLTIAAAVTCLRAGDTLLIHGGTYTGAANVIDSQLHAVASGTSWTNVITISAAPGEKVTLKPPYNVSGIRLTTGAPSYLVFQNFTIDMANSGPGADADGIFLFTAHHNRIKNVEVKNGFSFGVHFGDRTAFNEVIDSQIHHNGYPGSPSTIGHGLYITGSDNLFEGNDVYNNQGYGFHIYNNAGAHDDPSRNVIRRNRIHGNGLHGAPAYGVVIAWGTNNVVYNNLIYGNTAGIQVYTSATNTGVYNNTIHGNRFEGMMLQYYGPGTTIRNNIVFANGVNVSDYGGAATPMSDHNLMNDPIFTDEAAGDFTLRSWSAARDTGVTLATVLDDFAGTRRPAGGAYDIGALEFVPVTAPVTTPVPTPPQTTPVTTPITAPVTTPITTPITTPVTTPVTTSPQTTPVTTPVTTPTASVTTPVTTPATTPVPGMVTVTIPATATALNRVVTVALPATAGTAAGTVTVALPVTTTGAQNAVTVTVSVAVVQPTK